MEAKTNKKYIMFEGVIEKKPTLQFANAIRNINPQTGKPFDEIEIFFSSLGGDIHDGFTIASLIKNSKIPIRIHAYNAIDSIANVIYLAAKVRTAESYAKFYMHGATTSGVFYAKDLDEQETALVTGSTRIAHFIAEHCDLELEEVIKKMSVGTHIAAHEALKMGIVHSIEHKEIPAGAEREEIIFI